MESSNCDAQNRRAFFRWLVGESIATYEQLRGKPQARLNDLATLPNTEVATLRPGIQPGVEIVPTDDGIYAKIAAENRSVFLFSRDSEELAIFNCVNGRWTLAQIAELIPAQDRSPEEVFGAVRKHVLHLIGLGVCAPLDPPLRPEEEEEKVESKDIDIEERSAELSKTNAPQQLSQRRCEKGVSKS